MTHPAQQSLRDLIAKVATLEAGGNEADWLIAEALGQIPEHRVIERGWDHVWFRHPGEFSLTRYPGADDRAGCQIWTPARVTQSIDAAVAFTEALLPEAKKLIREEAKDWVTTHWRAVLELPKPPYTMVGDAPTPALALVLATLRAHAAKETT